MKKSLAIMAAGLGSRFGSLKQLHVVYNDYALIDYSIYDAIHAGFNEIIFIVRLEILNVFQKRYSNILPPEIQVKFVVQNAPTNTSRKKPWGTGHALLCLKPIVNNSFAIINADDFYGREAFSLIHDNLYSSKPQQNYFIGYKLSNTLSENGTVSRGECFLDNERNLLNIEERTQIAKCDNGLIYYQNTSGVNIELQPKTIVSMNFWGFNKSIFELAEKMFNTFKNEQNNFETKEFYITTIVDALINKNNSPFKMLSTSEKWFGITYKTDEIIVRNQIQLMIAQEIYPKKLY
jgi:dTDP-glucose pyrophosphorylase